MEAVTFTELQIKDTKRIKAVALVPAQSGLTVLGGKNRQGKTAFLDAIAFLLGGDKFRPTNLKRDGATDYPYMKVYLSNGLLVERKGKNSTLHVTDPDGKKAGQALLKGFISELALNIPKFLEMSGTSKAQLLLRSLGINDQLAPIEREIDELYATRTELGREDDRLQKVWESMPYCENTPTELVTVDGLLAELKAITDRNFTNEELERTRRDTDRDEVDLRESIQQKEKEIVRLEEKKRSFQYEVAQQNEMLASLVAEIEGRDPIPAPESTDEVNQKLNDMDEVNTKVRANQAKVAAEQEYRENQDYYKRSELQLEQARKNRMALLDGAGMPLEGLSVDDGELTFEGKAWDCMAGVEQICVAIAIVRKLKPECGFVLLDKLEAFDLAELQNLGEYLEGIGLQAIATRVSTGNECTIVIEDGLIAGEPTDIPAEAIPVKEDAPSLFAL